MQPPAIVMNMFYTGLGIARSLGKRGIPVIGLTSQRGIYGNYTRYAKLMTCPDSKKDPDALLAFLLALGRNLECRGVIFPTRDNDVVFLDRFREALTPFYSLVVPSASATAASLDKWQTYLCAREAGVPIPKCWLIESHEDLARAAHEARFPTVLKAVEAHYWRRDQNWEIVGARKAIPVRSPEELRAEYDTIAKADHRALLQEMIPGGDDCLVVTACYITRDGQWAGMFNAQKLIQEPAGFGTGCIVQTIHKPDLVAPTKRLLDQMKFTGIAEVEYKWHETEQCYQLIEVNPRPWDQHPLGQICGVDLIHLAYADHAGLPTPTVAMQPATCKWIADDTFVIAALRASAHRNGRLRALFRAARGKRVHAIWSAKDPLPFIRYFLGHLIPQLTWAGIQQIWLRLTSNVSPRTVPAKGTL